MDLHQVSVDPSEQDSESGGSKGVAARAIADMVRGVVNEGLGPITGSVDYAQARLRSAGVDVPGDVLHEGYPEAATNEAEAAIDRIVRESVIAAGTTGLVTGLGGFIALPVTLPANITGNLMINARMVGAIAYLRGYSLQDPHTEAMLMLVVAGSTAQGAASRLGVKVGQELTKQAIRRIPMTVIREINKRAGFYLLAKYGTKRAAVTLVKGVPVIGGLFGGGIDASLTALISGQAKKAFPPA